VAGIDDHDRGRPGDGSFGIPIMLYSRVARSGGGARESRNRQSSDQETELTKAS
jgi:hypothetical protein